MEGDKSVETVYIRRAWGGLAPDQTKPIHVKISTSPVSGE